MTADGGMTSPYTTTEKPKSANENWRTHVAPCGALTAVLTGVVYPIAQITIMN